MIRVGPVDAPPDGFYNNVPYDEYAAWDAWNLSTIRWAAHSMKMVRYKVEHPEDEDTPDKLAGRVFHCSLLERDAFAERYVIRPATYPVVKKKDGRPGSVQIAEVGLGYIYGHGTGEKRIEHDVHISWNDEIGGLGAWEMTVPEVHARLTLTPTKWTTNAKWCKRWEGEKVKLGHEIVIRTVADRAHRMADSLRAHPAFGKITENAFFEVSIVWTHRRTGLRCKARLDVWQPHTGQIADAKKSVRSVDGESFAWTVRKFGYAEQAAFYRDGATTLLKAEGRRPELPKWRWLAVEDFPPHDCAIYTLLDHQESGSWVWLQYGREMYNGWLLDIMHAIADDAWYGHNVGAGGLVEEMELEVPERMNLGVGVL